MKQGSRLAAIFVGMALVLFVSVVATYWMGMAVLRSNQVLLRQHAVISSLNQTMSTLKDAETGQRGYLLTGNGAYLGPYHVALDQIHSQLGTLSDEAKAGDLAADDVNDLASLTNQKLEELRYTIDLVQQGLKDKAVAHMEEGNGKRLMDAVRDRVSTMLATEESDLAARRRTADRMTTVRTTLFILVGLLNLGFLYWSFVRVRNEMIGRERAAAEMSRQKDLLAVTLASIGDAVIVTDGQGRITFLNKIAEDLTGWSLKEAAGRPCATVFNIISEESRDIVESPVEKVLRLGLVVGLANHTLLIRRDKSEVPIDDSGAPIRDADGAIRGVVLVFRDFTEQKTNERALRLAKEELEAASKAKDHFLATLSHELRTPLTPVLATLTTWEASDELPEAFREDVQMLRRNIALEARLIDDLLDLTRIVRGKLILETEVVDIHDLLRSVAGMYRSEIQGKEVKMTLTLNAANSCASVDPGRIQQVFWNILKNAAKFTPRGGKIDIQTENAADGSLQLTFRDTGIGMSKEMLERLFQPFAQGAEEAVRRAGGLGLGMAISKALVDVQKGNISAASEGSGKGSTFTVTLPSVPAPASLASGDAKREAKSRPQTRLLNILLVEDHADTARVMGRLLRRLGHTVETSDSVASALSAVSARDYDILLSDIGLPDGTGLELIRQIRTTKNIPAVALTGFGMDDDIAKCREAGFIAHLTKPVNFQRLEMVIQQVATAKGE